MFRISIQLTPPIIGGLNLEEGLAIFLSQTGLIKDASCRNKDPLFKIVYKCFLRNPDRVWDIKDVATEINVSAPTVYRALKKLRDCDLVEFVEGKENIGYRLRYGSLSKAWRFVETHVESSMENYRKSAEYIQKLVETDSTET